MIIAGLDRLPQVGSRSSLSTADSLQPAAPPEREARTLVVKNVSSDVDDSDVKQLFEVRASTSAGHLRLGRMPGSAGMFKQSDTKHVQGPSMLRRVLVWRAAIRGPAHAVHGVQGAGLALISYYNIIAAKLAKISLHGQCLSPARWRSPTRPARRAATSAKVRAAS